MPATGRRVLWLGLVFVLFLTAFLAIGLPDGRVARTLNVPLTANVDEAAVILGYSDARWYVENGRDLAVDHDLESRRIRHLNFWPPGMFLFWAVLFTVLGPDIPVGLTAVIVLAVLFAALLTVYADLFARYLPRWVIVLVLGAVVLSDAMSEGIFDQYLLLSEGLYVWWMLVAVYAALRLALDRSPKARVGWALATGVALGASAYVRTTSELLGRVLTTVVLLWVVVAVAGRLVVGIRARRDGARSESRPLSRHLIALALCMVAFHAVTVPWRVFAAQTIRPQSYTWSVATNKYWHLQWTPDRAFNRSGVMLFAQGGANTACKIDPATCRKVGIDRFMGAEHPGQARLRRMTLATFRAHPWEWANRRLVLLPHAWFGAPIPCGGGYQFSTCRTPVGVAASGHELLQNGLFLAALAAALGVSVRRMRRSGADPLALLLPSLVVATLAPFVFLHFEVRYFLPLKLLSAVVLGALIVADRAHEPTAPSQAAAAGARGPGARASGEQAEAGWRDAAGT